MRYAVRLALTAMVLPSPGALSCANVARNRPAFFDMKDLFKIPQIAIADPPRTRLNDITCKRWHNLLTRIALCAKLVFQTHKNSSISLTEEICNRKGFVVANCCSVAQVCFGVFFVDLLCILR